MLLAPLLVLSGFGFLIYSIYYVLQFFLSPIDILKAFVFFLLLNALPLLFKALSSYLWSGFHGLGAVLQLWQLMVFIYAIIYSFVAGALYILVVNLKILNKNQKPYFALFLAVSALLATGLTLLYGNFKAKTIVTTNYQLTLNAEVEEEKEYKIAFISDIHLGYVHGKEQLKKMVAKVNQEKPDLILIGGDILHYEYEPFEDEKLYLYWQGFNAPLGVYAVDGNHDAYCGQAESLFAYLEEAGTIDARNKGFVIDDSFILVGRQDKGGMRNSKSLSRPSIDALLDGLPENLPVLVLDHQPTNLEETTSHPRVELLFSGHTHRGQFWPVTFFTDRLYDINYGLKDFDNAKVLVTSGIGTWGPTFRLGSVSEVALLNLKITNRTN